MKVVAAVAQIDVYNKARGVTYVYESISYWDKDLKQPRSKRTLIGKRDADGNIIPTGGRGRKKSAVFGNESAHSDTNDARTPTYDRQTLRGYIFFATILPCRYQSQRAESDKDG